MQIEICIDSVDSALAAQQGGANRVELCSALSEGGLTPSAGLIQAVGASLSIPLFVMIRPRGGSFVYNENEYRVMREDIALVQRLGCNGVVLGLLTLQGKVDMERTRALVELARPMETTFHRAFDEVCNLNDALEDVIGCGASRILTSGGAANAHAGAQQLADLNARAKGRIRLMAGGGVRVENVTEILHVSRVEEIHSSLISHPGQDPIPAVTAQATPWPSVRPEDVRKLKRLARLAMEREQPRPSGEPDEGARFAPPSNATEYAGTFS